MNDLQLTIERTIKAPIEKVYNAWLNPEIMMKFMLPGEGMTCPKAEANPKVGGRFSIIMSNDGQEIPHGGEYLALDPHSLIQFTWESPFSVDGSNVTLKLQSENGHTLLTLIHVKFPNEEVRDNHNSGWTSILNQLDNIL